MADLPTPDAVLEATEAAGYEGAVCATLTPLIKRRPDDAGTCLGRWTGSSAHFRGDEPSGYARPCGKLPSSP
ncbi:MAG: hypothetical protein ACOYW9_16555 [Deinococcota bacterium]